MSTPAQRAAEAIGGEFADSIDATAVSETSTARQAVAFFLEDGVANARPALGGRGGPVFDALRSSLAGAPGDVGWRLFERPAAGQLMGLLDRYRRLAHALAADLAATDPARVMRLAATGNWKGGRPSPVSCVYASTELHDAGLIHHRLKGSGRLEPR